jgi:hypothetical protein
MTMYGEVEVYLHALATLPARKEPPKPTGGEDGWAQEPAEILWKSLPCRVVNSDSLIAESLAYSPAAI